MIEHNLDVLLQADLLIDLGPEGGDKGGNLVASGTPEALTKHAKSYTGFYIKKMLDRRK
jgi:excinuclease ABC subunit A